MSQLTVSKLAEQAGTSADTVRYYERIGLLPETERSASGYRLYGDEAVERLRFIKQAQEIGFSLGEIGELLSIGGEAECRRVRDLLRGKLTELDTRLKAMHRFRRTLASHLDACERELKRHGAAACCPVVVEIKGDQRSRK